MSEFNPNRRAFFRRLVNAPTTASMTPRRRPPFAQDESAFLGLCNQCGECLRACPDNLINMDNGFPQYTRAHYCDDCTLCVQSCPTGALNKHLLTLHIRPQCSPQVASFCRSCEDVCPTQAITIEANQQPIINEQQCNRCGRCMAACDFQALYFQNHQ